MYHFPTANIAKKHSAKRALGIVINMHFFLFFLTHYWDVIQILLSDKQRRVHSKRDDALMKMHYAGRVVCVKKKWVSCAILLTLG